MKQLLSKISVGSLVVVMLVAASIGIFSVTSLQADETCMSPYMAKITGQEDFVYVWTLGVEGLGDGSDKLVTIDVRPGSKTYGKVIHTLSVGGTKRDASCRPHR